MAESSGIRWTHHTHNFWLGCVKVSEGCRHCYAETLITRRMGADLWGPAKTTNRRKTSEPYWRHPLQWNARAKRAGVVDRVFSLSLGDFFEPHPQLVELRAQAWDVIRQTPFLSYMLLTKRPEEIPGMLPPDWGKGWLNVGLGTSVENMKVAHRLDELRQVPCLYRFVSYEPALGFLHEANLDDIHQVLYGGESGPDFRPHDLAWPRAMRAVCRERGIAFFYKQASAPRTEMYQELDGERIEEMPDYHKIAEVHGRVLRLNTMSARRDDVLAAMQKRVALDRSGQVTVSSKHIVEGNFAPRHAQLPML